MPDIWMDVDTALAEVPVNLMPLLDSGDFVTRETAVAYNAAGMDLVWNFVTTGGSFTQTAVTPTTGGSYDWTHQGDGIYTIEIPASGGASINNDTEGFGWFTGLATGVLPWRGPTIGFRAAALNNDFIDGATSIVATLGAAGAGLTAVPWNAAWDTEVQSEVQDAIEANNLDHLVGTATGIPAVPSGTFLDQIMDDGTAVFDRTTDSLQAIRDSGGTTLTQVIHPIFLVPPVIDVANTATMRIAIHLTNQLADLPSTAEITPGTIAIDRKAAGATSWTNVVAATAMSESAGLIYYDATFAAASGYTRGDVIRFTFAGQAVVVAATTYEITPSGGAQLYSWIPETNGLTTALIADAVWDEALSGHLTGGSTGAALNNMPDSVWDEVLESGAPSIAQTARQWMRLFAAALFGKDGGVGDWSARDVSNTKTRIAATLSAAGKRSSIDTLDGS